MLESVHAEKQPGAREGFKVLRTSNISCKPLTPTSFFVFQEIFHWTGPVYLSLKMAKRMNSTMMMISQQFAYASQKTSVRALEKMVAIRVLAASCLFVTTSERTIISKSTGADV